MTVTTPAPDVAVRSILTPLGVSVVTRVPATRPAKFINLIVTGGNRANLVQGQPMVVVECWASTIDDASDLAQDAWRLLEAEYGPDLDATLPADFPDPESGQERWQFVIRPIMNLLHN